MMKNNGNYTVENMWKVINDFDEMNPKNYTADQVDKLEANYGSAEADKDRILGKMGIEDADFNKESAIQILENILDSGTQNATPQEAYDYLLTSYRLNEWNGDNDHVLATNDLGLTYILQDAEDIIANIRNFKVMDKVEHAFNYLDIVDGNELSQYGDKFADNIDALYFGKNNPDNKFKQMATVGDLKKEYLHGLHTLKAISNQVDLDNIKGTSLDNTKKIIR